jgi:hypothetical protein
VAHDPNSLADFGKILLTLKPSTKCTPPGRNMYYYSYRHSTIAHSYYLHTINMSTEDHNFAASCVTARGVETDVTISNTRAQIIRWFDECAEHELCPGEEEVSLPTRLIDVATTRIVLTRGKLGKYAALSYCWGSSPQTLLHSSILLSFTRHLELESLPQTIKESILVTRSLSTPFLWVSQSCQWHSAMLLVLYYHHLCQ